MNRQSLLVLRYMDKKIEKLGKRREIVMGNIMEFRKAQILRAYIDKKIASVENYTGRKKQNLVHIVMILINVLNAKIERIENRIIKNVEITA